MQNPIATELCRSKLLHVRQVVDEPIADGAEAAPVKEKVGSKSERAGDAKTGRHRRTTYRCTTRGKVVSGEALRPTALF
jgi:hypothetical protein